MRKPQFQPALASLTDAEREQLADWLRRDSYDIVLERVNKPRPEGFGLDISIKPLQTFYAKVALFDLINSRLSDDKKLTLPQFESLAAGATLFSLTTPSGSSSQTLSETLSNLSAPTPNPNLLTSEKSAVLSSLPSFPSIQNEKLLAAHDAILTTVHDLATSGENTPTQLLNLQRLADFPARAEFRQQRHDLDRQKFTHKQDMDSFRKEIATARLDLAKQSLALREKRLLASENHSAIRNPNSAIASDPLGPAARNWDDVSERARIHFDVSKEEWARRQSLHQSHNEDGTLKDAQTSSESLS